MNKRKSQTVQEIEWCGRVYRRDPSAKQQSRRRYYMATTAPRTYLHYDIYRMEHGEVPPGFQIHHADFDFDNNAPDNLVALSFQNHRAVHWANRKWLNKVCQNCGISYTATFERSKWCSCACKEAKRRELGKAYKKPRSPASYASFTCLYCSNVFYSQKKWAKFCGLKCRNSFNSARRKGEKNE